MWYKYEIEYYSYGCHKDEGLGFVKTNWDPVSYHLIIGWKPSKQVSINHSQSVKWWRWIDGSDLQLSSCVSNIPAQITSRGKGQGIRQAGVIANYQTVFQNWVLIQRKIGYPASPAKTNLESSAPCCSVMIKLMPSESVIINQIWWEWINSQSLDVVQHIGPLHGKEVPTLTLLLMVILSIVCTVSIIFESFITLVCLWFYW